MSGCVPSLVRLIFVALIQKEIVQQSASCRASMIISFAFANPKAEIGYKKRVLKNTGAAMLGIVLHGLNVLITNEVVDALEIFRIIISGVHHGAKKLIQENLLTTVATTY